MTFCCLEPLEIYERFFSQRLRTFELGRTEVKLLIDSLTRRICFRQTLTIQKLLDDGGHLSAQSFEGQSEVFQSFHCSVP
jgi:hypothetical protein